MNEDERTPTPPSAERPPEEETRAAAADSPPSPRASSAASAFVGDPGPDFEPGNAREGFEAPEPGGADLHAPPPAELGWEEDSVRSILTAKGAAIHALAGVAEEDWLYTEADLAAIAPPLTRILNRYPVTQAAAGAGDELAVVIAFGGYGMRSWAERKAMLDALADAEEIPASGRAAEPGTGPDQPQPEEKTWQTPQ